MCEISNQPAVCILHTSLWITKYALTLRSKRGINLKLGSVEPNKKVIDYHYFEFSDVTSVYFAAQKLCIFQTGLQNTR